jgi:dimeric dUTPase (all-alpha-NTP-PPase superfamily)
MDIQKLCEMQEAFDNKIITDKCIVWTAEERFNNTLVALDVELAEFANEARWFKRWSENQNPHIKGERQGKTKDGLPARHIETYNPLLEEFADAVHFFLSIANQKGWHDELFLYEESLLDLKESGFDGGLNGIYLEVKYNLSKLLGTNKEDFFIGKSSHEFAFRSAWFCFVAIGMIGFNFTWEDIEEAYLLKHKTNHERQANGY